MHGREKGNRVPWMGEQGFSVFFCRFGQRAASDDFMRTEYATARPLAYFLSLFPEEERGSWSSCEHAEPE